jgi:hypothetical protein
MVWLGLQTILVPKNHEENIRFGKLWEAQAAESANDFIHK